MGHIGILPGHGVRLNLVAIFILIPTAFNLNEPFGSIFVRKSVQVHKHPVLVRRDIIAVLIHEVQHYISLLIYGIKVIPIPNDNLQFLSLQ